MTPVISNSLIKANRRLQRFCLIVLSSAIAVGCLSIFFSQKLIHHLHQPSHTLSQDFLLTVSHSLFVLTSLFVLGLLLFMTWAGYVGMRSLREGCYPPSHTPLICDTLHVTGWRATVKAIAALLLAIAAGLGAVGISFEICAFLAL